MLTTVYWIRREGHSDIMSEGYVGISNNFGNRVKQHYKRQSNLHMKNALAKYDDIVAEEYFIAFDRESAKELENELRPMPKVGWNDAVGGDYPPDIREYPDAIEKIRNSIKSLGMNPYCENTHSAEAINKRIEARKNKVQKWYHNPDTLEYKMFSTAIEDIPVGWVPGRKPKKLKANKVRGKDYQCNVKHWILYIDNVVAFEGKNLKQYLVENGYKSIYPNLTKIANTDKVYKSIKLKKTFMVKKLDTPSRS